MRYLQILMLLLCPLSVCAHGVSGHVHVTGWAVENLPPGPLKAFLQDPEVFNAVLIGAAFPDSGYAAQDNYGEIAHWEPFVDAYLDFVATQHGPDFDSAEGRRQVGFLLGLASHGLQDELFDTAFLRYVQQEDSEGQDAADPGTDAFLAVDGHLRFNPTAYAPADDLVGVFESRGYAVDAATIRTGVARIKFVLDAFPVLAPDLDAEHRPNLPWTADHYLDVDVPGSLMAEVEMTAGYMEALWARLHNRWPGEAYVIGTWPSSPRRLRTVRADRVGSRITVILGAGAVVRSVNAERVRLLDPEGLPVPIGVFNTRWSGRPGDSTRLIEVRPQADLEPETDYTLHVDAGLEWVWGDDAVAGWSTTIRTGCPSAEACADRPEAWVPDIDGPDAQVGPDAEVSDADVFDAEASDAGAADGGPDAQVALSDMGSGGDAEPVVDAAVGDAAPAAETSGGGGCSLSSRPMGGPWLLMGGLLIIRRSKKKRKAGSLRP